MRTTIDLPDELYRTIKARAAIRGISLRELVTELIEQGLTGSHAGDRRLVQEPLPVAIPGPGRPTMDIDSAKLHELEVEDYLRKLERSS